MENWILLPELTEKWGARPTSNVHSLFPARSIAGLGIQCYECGENSVNGQCNETYKGAVTECAYDDQSCVATVGEFGDVIGKSVAQQWAWPYSMNDA